MTQDTHHVRVGIIGTAGREPNIMALCTPETFNGMIEQCVNALETFKLTPQQVTLVSGGAAVADHAAVALYNANHAIAFEIHAPCKWDVKNHAFEDTGVRDSMINPGGRANQLHRDFARVSGVPSLKQLDALYEVSQSARLAPVSYTAHRGFHARNRAIAASADYLIAIGFGPVMTAGTRMTWDLCEHGERVYIDAS